MKLTTEQIKEIIPHRAPFLLIDEVEDFEAGKWAKAVKHVSADEPYFVGHFPGYPVMPGVLIIEALAQAGAVALLALPENRGKIGLFGGIKEARFKRQVRPGDVLSLECVIERVRGPVGIGSATARVDGEIACSAKLTFALMENKE